MRCLTPLTRNVILQFVAIPFRSQQSSCANTLRHEVCTTHVFGPSRLPHYKVVHAMVYPNIVKPV